MLLGLDIMWVLFFILNAFVEHLVFVNIEVSPDEFRFVVVIVNLRLHVLGQFDVVAEFGQGHLVLVVDSSFEDSGLGSTLVLTTRVNGDFLLVLDVIK